MKFCKVCKDYLLESCFGRRSNTCKSCKKLGTKALATVTRPLSYSFAPAAPIPKELVNVLHYL